MDRSSHPRPPLCVPKSTRLPCVSPVGCHPEPPEHRCDSPTAIPTPRCSKSCWAISTFLPARAIPSFSAVSIGSTARSKETARNATAPISKSEIDCVPICRPWPERPRPLATPTRPKRSSIWCSTILLRPIASFTVTCWRGNRTRRCGGHFFSAECAKWCCTPAVLGTRPHGSSPRPDARSTTSSAIGRWPSCAPRARSNPTSTNGCGRSRCTFAASASPPAATSD